MELTDKACLWFELRGRTRTRWLYGSIGNGVTPNVVAFFDDNVVAVVDDAQFKSSIFKQRKMVNDDDDDSLLVDPI